MSDPYERDMCTKILKPNLASHAPNVNRIILMVGRGNCIIYIIDGINRTKLNIIPSKHSNDIRKWVRCDRKARIVA